MHIIDRSCTAPHATAHKVPHHVSWNMTCATPYPTTHHIPRQTDKKTKTKCLRLACHCWQVHLPDICCMHATAHMLCRIVFPHSGQPAPHEMTAEFNRTVRRVMRMMPHCALPFKGSQVCCGSPWRSDMSPPGELMLYLTVTHCQRRFLLFLVRHCVCLGDVCDHMLLLCLLG